MKNYQPKKVRSTFHTNGLSYTHIKRDGLITIYEVSSCITQALNYEVAILRVMPEEYIKGELYPKRERYPSNEEFGSLGWSHPTLEDAEKRFDLLVKSFRDMHGYDDSGPWAA